MKNKVAIVLVSLVLLSACREIEEPTQFGPDYFPLEVGHEWIYAVDSIVFDNFTSNHRVYALQRKEVVVSSFATENGKKRFEVDVFYKTDSTPWNYVYTTTVFKDQYKAVRNVDNKEVVNLLFPIKDRVYWDANQLNTEREDRYRYRESEKWMTTLSDSFPSTVFVEQEFDTTIIDDDIRWELYAEGIGLVERKEVLTEKQFGKKAGYDYHWKLISFKK